MKVCKVCFKDIKCEGINSLIGKKNICQNCFNEFDVIFQNEKVDNVDTFFIYRYNDFSKKLIYQFKGCYDIELKHIFLERYLFVLKFRYRGYYIVPIPSSEIDDKERGFNHVQEIFSLLDLPFLYSLKKKNNFKQSSKTKNERMKIINSMEIINKEKIKGKKILIVDDIYTSGNTLKTAIKLIKEAKPKKIKALVLCKNCRKSVNFLVRKDY